MENGGIKDIELEGIKNIVFPGTFSIVITCASAVYALVDFFCDKRITSISAFVAMAAIIFISIIVEKHIKKVYAYDRTKAHRFKDKVDRYARLATYCGAIVFSISLVLNMF